MFCALSGEAPEEPVVSKLSGQVFEKRLILKYIADNGRDPVSGEELTQDDLLPLKLTNKFVKPRPPTATSVPNILLSLQNEWDAVMLESYQLKQQYHNARQELSNSLYENDAAKRVIARLIKERDEARAALAAFKLSNTSDSKPAEEDSE
ncbi:Prp19/Pso4-like-domain-containing protein [Phlyctochytrium arcticum]|nr:Prp19/Pso4-like-domain-containing protein [Phlyctochytrium arcticum]